MASSNDLQDHCRAILATELHYPQPPFGRLHIRFDPRFSAFGEPNAVLGKRFECFYMIDTHDLPDLCRAIFRTNATTPFGQLQIGLDPRCPHSTRATGALGKRFDFFYLIFTHDSNNLCAAVSPTDATIPICRSVSPHQPPPPLSTFSESQWCIL